MDFKKFAQSESIKLKKIYLNPAINLNLTFACTSRGLYSTRRISRMF